MTKQTIRVLTILLMALLLQSGCATVQARPSRQTALQFNPTLIRVFTVLNSIDSRLSLA